MYPIEHTIIRPRTSIIFIPFIIISGIFVFAYTQDPDQKELNIALLIAALVTAILWFAVKKTEILINNEGLVHKTIFTTKEILWHDIKRTHIKYVHHGKSGNVYWFFETTDNQLKFSTSMYSRRNLRAIAEAVVTKCDKTVIEDKIVNMSESRFPWYIF